MSGQVLLVSINIFIGVFLMIIGIYIQKARAYHLIAGYNTMSKEKKDQFDIERFAKVFRNVFVIMGFFIIIAYPVLQLLNFEKYLSLIIILIILPGVLFLNFRGYFYSKKTTRSGNPEDQ